MWQMIGLFILASFASTAYGCGRNLALYNVTIAELLSEDPMPNGHLVSGTINNPCDWILGSMTGLSIIHGTSGANRWKGAKLIHIDPLQSRFDRWIADVRVGHSLQRTYIPTDNIGQYDIIIYDVDTSPPFDQVPLFCVKMSEELILDKHSYDFVYNDDLGSPFGTKVETNPVIY